MSMMSLRPSTHTASAALALTFAASLLAGCASDAGRDPGSGYSTGFVISSPGWLNGELAQPEPGTIPASAPLYAGNVALRPNETWLGTIGLRRQLSDSYEVGIGFAVPNPFPGDAQSPVAAERARDIGVGVWLTFEF
jgi:hypothetical protein